MIEHARTAHRCGWTIFPLKPKSKQPLTAHGFKDATRVPELLGKWWSENPHANVGVACGESGLAVLDCDKGLANVEEFEAWRTRNNIPVSYAVRTGRRVNDKGEPAFGVQIYYAGAVPTTANWKLDGVSGDVKSIGGYVLAAGCVHPDSGETYQVISDAPIVPTPEVVKNLKTFKPARPAPGTAGPAGTQPKIAHGGRYNFLASYAGRLLNAGLNREDMIYQALVDKLFAECENPETADMAPIRKLAFDTAHKFEQAEQPVADETVIQTRCAADVKPELVNWLWENKIPLGELTVYCGMPDCGKSSAAIDLAARVTRGEDFPCGVANTLGGPRSVVFMIAEDSIEHTVVPRLKAAGADLTRVHFVEKTAVTFKAKKSERMLALDTDMKALQEKVEELGDVKLIVIDPLASYLGAIRKNEEKGVRAKLEDMREWAKEKSLAIVFLDHFNKNNSQDAMHRISGTGALSAVPRAAWGFFRDDTEPKLEEEDDDKSEPADENKLMLCLKLNLVPEHLKRGMMFRHDSVPVEIEGKFSSQPRILWLGTTKKTPAELAAAKKRGPKDTIAKDTQKALLNALKAGPRASAELMQIMVRAGYSKKTIERARENIGVVSYKTGNTWYMRLPDGDDIESSAGRKKAPTIAAEPTAEAEEAY